jgi:hypothetical protein
MYVTFGTVSNLNYKRYFNNFNSYVLLRHKINDQDTV